MYNKIDITEFLLSNEDRKVFKHGAIYVVLKEHINEDIVFLYSKWMYESNLHRASIDEYKFLCIYNNKLKTVYFLDSYNFETSLNNIEVLGLRNEIERILWNKITQYAKEHYPMEKIEYSMKEDRQEKAIKDYFDDVQPSFDITFNGNLDIGKNDILNYVIDKNLLLDDKYDDFIRNKQEYLLRYIQRELGHNKQLEKLYDDPGLWEINKKIYKALNKEEYEDAKTITITIEYDSDELTFKFDKRSVMGYLECGLCFTSYGKNWSKVKELLTKHKSYEKYGYQYDDCDFMNITKITYGRKVIYEV